MKTCLGVCDNIYLIHEGALMMQGLYNITFALALPVLVLLLYIVTVWRLKVLLKREDRKSESSEHN